MESVHVLVGIVKEETRILDVSVYRMKSENEKNERLDKNYLAGIDSNNLAANLIEPKLCSRGFRRRN